MNNLTQFAQMLATRYNGTAPGLRHVTRFSVWNEPNLEQFLTPQFSGTKIVSPGDLREALHGRLQRASRQATRRRWSPPARPRTAATTSRPTGSDSVAPATFARLLSRGQPEAARSTPGRRTRTRPSRARPDRRRSRTRTSRSRRWSEFGADLQKWFHRRVPIWVTEYAEQTRPEYHRRRQLRAAGSGREEGAPARRRRAVRRDVHLVHLPRQHRPARRGSAGSRRSRARRSRRTPPSPRRRRESSGSRSSSSADKRSRSSSPSRS